MLESKQVDLIRSALTRARVHIQKPDGTKLSAEGWIQTINDLCDAAKRDIDAPADTVRISSRLWTALMDFHAARVGEIAPAPEIAIILDEVGRILTESPQSVMPRRKG